MERQANTVLKRFTAQATAPGRLQRVRTLGALGVLGMGIMTTRVMCAGVEQEASPRERSPIASTAVEKNGAVRLAASQTTSGNAGSGASVRSGSRAPRQMEKLGRGVVAINQGGGKVWIGWRILGTEPENIAFNVYRSAGGGAPVKLNQRPLTGPTNFVDSTVNFIQANAYFVRPVLRGREQPASASFTLPANPPARPYLSIPLRTPRGYAPNDASVADLDGDGEYEIILHQTGRGKDNSQSGETDPPVLQAYKLDGTLLWTINLGKNIREGAHYTQFMVYDLDGDGRAEMVCKTADGTTDGTGVVIGDANANYVDEGGRILRGPEFLTVFDGLTGKALATTNYIPGRHPTKQDPTGDEMKAIWGDGYGNRGDRFLACVAYLDGVRPSVVMCRGYYTRSVLAAWDWRDGKLTSRWVFDSSTPGNEQFAGQGNHSLSVGDVDNDGKDEIVYGKMAVDDDGKGMYSTRIGHGDANHLTDIDIERPGLEMFSIQEPFSDAGAHLFDARTGEILWKKASVLAATSGGDKGEGPGRGLALDVDPRYPGLESWVAGAGLSNQMWDAKGNKIADRTPSVNFGAWWDGDLLREPLDGTKIDKWDYVNAKSVRLLSAHDYGCVANNGTKANPSLSADILGDWREEVIYRNTDNNELRIFTTTIPTEHRFYTLMHDPIYRLSIAWQNVAYNQPPHTGFYIGPGMQKPPRPAITTQVQMRSGQ
jgi:rhamnogalacturonan endolyase